MQLLDFINGILTIIFVMIIIITGIKIITKFSRFKGHESRPEFIFVGLAGILLTEFWWPSIISFLLILIIGQGLSLEMYFLIGYILFPLTLLIWVFIITDFALKAHQKATLTIFAIYGVLYEIFFIYFLFSNPSFLGKLHGSCYVCYGFFMLVFLFSLLIVVMITGTFFSMASLKSKNPENRLKGKFLALGYYIFLIGVILEEFSKHFSLLWMIAKIILIISAIQFYIGFNMPSWVQKRYIKTI